MLGDGHFDRNSLRLFVDTTPQLFLYSLCFTHFSVGFFNHYKKGYT